MAMTSVVWAPFFIVIASLCSQTHAFHAGKLAINLPKNSVRASAKKISLNLSNNNKNGSFDISKPTIDLFSLRAVRGDALLRYNTLNQSEPLRINLYLLASLALLAFPSVSEAVLGEPTGAVGTAASTVSGLASLALFGRECQKRSNQIGRIEKECMASDLTLRLPNVNRFEAGDRSVYTTAGSSSVGDLRGSKKIIALIGNAMELKKSLLMFRVLRRRLMQAAVVVVAVSTDGSTFVDWGMEATELASAPYLAMPYDQNQWIEYFNTLIGASNVENVSNLAWFGLTASGRSFGSGRSEQPRLLEILGQSLLPIDLFYESDEADLGSGSNSAVTVEEVLSAQKQFYVALTTGDLNSLEGLCDNDSAPEVEEVIQLGGRLDNWAACLEDGARPTGMRISGSDVLVVSDNEAFSTTIEFPQNVGMDSATLLAVQRWGRKEGGGWKLQLHQTIPWSPGTRAGGTLRCDCRGCVALARGPDRRTMGGLLG